MEKTDFDIKTIKECFKEENREYCLGGVALDRILSIISVYCGDSFTLYLTEEQVKILENWCSSDTCFDGALNKKNQTYKGFKYFIKGE